MRAMLIAPENTQLPSFPDDVKVRLVREGTVANLEFSPPCGIILLLVRPELVTNVKELLRLANTEIATNKACAFIPATEQGGQSLATAATAYAFNAKDLHLAGGIDSRLSLEEMGMDAMFRLASRACTVVAMPTELVSDIPVFSISSYLTVFNRNLTSSTQLRYLAPLFLGLIDQPLRDAGVDTSELDLQRSPGNDDIPKLVAPGTAFSGAQLIRTWLDDLPISADAKITISKARRIPDIHLNGLDAFVDEMWRASGIPADIQHLLRQAFADIATPASATLLYAVRTSNDEACRRVDEIHSSVNIPAFRYDPDTSALHYSAGAEDPWTDATNQFAEARACSIVYLVDVLTREVPWVQASPSVAIFDVTVTDLFKWLRADFNAVSHTQKVVGSRASYFAETLNRVDRVIVKDDTQRDFLLGAMSAVLRLNMHTYDEDHSLTNLIAIEQGTQVARYSIKHPCKPFECVDNSEEYKRSIFDGVARTEHSFTDILRDSGERISERVKGVFA